MKSITQTWLEIDDKVLCSPACPWGSDDTGVNYGCLPSSGEMVKHAIEHNEIMSCHEDDTKKCTGVVKHLRANGFDTNKMGLLPHSEWYD